MRNSYYNISNVIATLKSTQRLTLRGMKTLRRINEENKIEIINGMGVILQTVIVNSYNHSLDVSALRDGIYFVRISNSNKSKIFKIIISR